MGARMQFEQHGCAAVSFTLVPCVLPLMIYHVYNAQTAETMLKCKFVKVPLCQGSAASEKTSAGLPMRPGFKEKIRLMRGLFQLDL